MKKVFILILLCASVMVQAQPKARGIDSVRWNTSLQALFQYPGGTNQGGLLDSRGNFILPRGNVSTGFRNTMLGTNMTMGGTANTGFGNNHQVGAPIGIFVSGADSYVDTKADYSTTMGDAQNAFAIGALTNGFGHYAYNENGTTLGTNNVNGALDRVFDASLANRYRSSFISGENMFGAGNRQFGHGFGLRMAGNDIYAFGTNNFTNSWYNITAPGFYYISGGVSVFEARATGHLVINGLSYRWPTSQGTGYLYNDGSGNLSWGAPAIAKSQPVSEQPIMFKVMDVTGRLLFYQQLKIQR